MRWEMKCGLNTGMINCIAYNNLLTRVACCRTYHTPRASDKPLPESWMLSPRSLHHAVCAELHTGTISSKKPLPESWMFIITQCVLRSCTPVQLVPKLQHHQKFRRLFYQCLLLISNYIFYSKNKGILNLSSILNKTHWRNFYMHIGLWVISLYFWNRWYMQWGGSRDPLSGWG